MSFNLAKVSVLVATTAFGLMSCKTPNANQTNVSDENGAMVGGWQACDASVERVNSATERLLKLKERFNLLRALLEIGPNTATMVTREALNQGKIPSSLVAEGYPASPEASNEKVESLKAEYNGKSVVREMMNLAQEIVLEANGPEKANIRTEILSELRTFVEQLNEQIESSKNNPDKLQELLLSRLIAKGTITSIDPASKEAWTAKSFEAEVASIVKSGVIENGELLKEVAFLEILAKSSEQVSEQRVRELLASLQTQIEQRSANNLNTQAGARVDAIHSTYVSCTNAGGCSEKKVDTMEKSRLQSTRSLEKANNLVAAKQLEKVQLQTAYEAKFNKVTRAEVESNRGALKASVNEIERASEAKPKEVRPGRR